MSRSKRASQRVAPPESGTAKRQMGSWSFHRPGTWILLMLGLAVVGMGIVLAISDSRSSSAEAADRLLALEDIPFDGQQALDYVKQLCAIGPRPTGSAGMAEQQRLLRQHFEPLGGEVELQPFTMPHPTDGTDVAGANLIVRWHPELKERVLLAAHYDTLPYPMLDPVDRHGKFVGANDGASGVGILMALGHRMNEIEPPYGVDFVFLDAEEYIFKEGDPFFIGSTHFAEQYVANRENCHYRWGILLDMVGDADLGLPMERHSATWTDTRPLTREIWGLARRLGVREFIPRVGSSVRDDHVALHSVGKIPCIDIIDFDYPPWHTQGDTPDKLSALSLAKVGWVIEEWLKTVK